MLPMRYSVIVQKHLLRIWKWLTCKQYTWYSCKISGFVSLQSSYNHFHVNGNHKKDHI